MSELLGTVRASSWAEMFDCSLRWKFKHIDGLRSPSSCAAHLGTSVHAGTAAFDEAVLAGAPISPDTAAGVMVDTLRNPDAEVEWDTPIRDAERVGLLLTTRYCTEIAPNVRYQSVELACEKLDITTPHGIIRVTGTIDRIRIRDDGSKNVRDLKSGMRAASGDGSANTAGHHLQVGIYTIMTEAETGERLDAPAEILGMSTAKSAHIGCSEIPDVHTPLLGTADQMGMIEMAALMLKSGLMPPNPKSQLCSPKYCAGYSRCRYHG